MKQQKQKGFAHILILVTLSSAVLIGFAGYRVISTQDKSQNYNKTATKSGIATKDSTAKTATIQPEVTKAPEPTPPAPQKTQTNKPAPAPSTSTLKPPSVTAPQKRTITFTKGGGSLQGDYVIVSANLSEAQSGTCTYSFTLNGSERVRVTGPVTSTNVCYKSIPASSFPKSASYSFVLSFLSSDGLVSATQPAYDIEIL